MRAYFGVNIMMGISALPRYTLYWSSDEFIGNTGIKKTMPLKVFEKLTECLHQGGHGTGKTGNLAVNFSRQGKHREFSKFNFLHRENCGNTGKILKI